ncbi:MAG TPA: type II secretion system F family protein, partial [Gemmatimonadales bacterium]|nr:type II secretion system F family protein [Gemmatimonadales bacterium]
MLVLIGILVLFCVASIAVIATGGLTSGRAVAVSQRLDELQRTGDDLAGIRARRKRQERSDRIKLVLQAVGERVGEGRRDTSAVRQFLVQAGYPDPAAVQIYWAARFTLAALLGGAALLLAPVLHLSSGSTFLAVAWFGGMGWVGPTFFVRSKLNARQKELQLALPDMLDMMVVCVEAGLGLNQALVRVADEIEHVSPVTSEHLALVNMEIRAGTPREDALRHFA